MLHLFSGSILLSFILIAGKVICFVSVRFCWILRLALSPDSVGAVFVLQVGK